MGMLLRQWHENIDFPNFCSRAELFVEKYQPMG
jgi:hypothetical protein